MEAAALVEEQVANVFLEAQWYLLHFISAAAAAAARNTRRPHSNACCAPLRTKFWFNFVTTPFQTLFSTCVFCTWNLQTCNSYSPPPPNNSRSKEGEEKLLP